MNAGDFGNLVVQVPTVIATFLFCGWLVKFLFDRLVTIAVERILDRVREVGDRQAAQIDRIIILLQEHIHGGRPQR